MLASELPVPSMLALPVRVSRSMYWPSQAEADGAVDLVGSSAVALEHRVAGTVDREDVVAGAAFHDVGAKAAVQEVVAAVALEDVRGSAADDGFAALAAPGVLEVEDRLGVAERHDGLPGREIDGHEAIAEGDGAVVDGVDPVAAVMDVEVDQVLVDDAVVALAAEHDVGSLAAGHDVVACAGIDRELDEAGGEAAGIDRVVAAEAVEDQPVVGAFGIRKLDGRGEAGDADHAARRRDGRGIGAGRPVDDDLVGLRIAAADAGAEVDLDQGHAGWAEVVDVHRVGPAERVKLDGPRAGNVHDDVGDVAGQPHAPAVGGEVDYLGRVGAVEPDRVGSGLALDRVVAVARIPLEHVVAGPEKDDVVALLAVDEIVAAAADQNVGAIASQDRVVADAAVDRDADERRQIAGGAERIVAAVHVDDEALGGADVEGERRRIDPVEAHPRAVGGRGEDLRAVAAVDLGGVGAVAALEQVGIVAGIPDRAVVAGLAEHLVVAVAAGQRVVAVAAEQQVVAAHAENDVVVASAGQLVADGAAREDIVAAQAVEHDPVVGGFGIRDFDGRGKTGDADHPTGRRDGRGVRTRRPVDDHPVGLRVAAADAGGEVDLDQGHVRSAEVVDTYGVGAAERANLDGLDVVEVHDNAGDVARQPHAPAVGGDVDYLGRVGAVEQQPVGSVLALDDVAAVAGIPLERVVSGAEKGDVVTLLAVDEVVAVAAEQEVGAIAAEDGVVAGAAVDRDADERCQIAGGAERVVAAVHVDDEPFRGADVEGEGRRVDAVEAHPRAVGGRGEGLRAIAAVDLGGVGAVAALHQVAVVAGIPDHPVVAGLAEHLVVGIAAGQRVVVRAAEQEVVAALAEQNVVAGLAEKLVAARAAGERVVARAAEQVGPRQRTVHLAQRDDVGAVLAEHLDQRRVGDGRRAALHRDRAAVDEQSAGRVAADGGVVVQRVAEYRQHPIGGRERRRNRHVIVLSRQRALNLKGRLNLDRSWAG